MAKQRITVTVDSEVVDAARASVDAGSAESLSRWMADAATEKVERERRLRAGEAAITAYETEFGEITPEEVEAQRRADHETAVIVRGSNISGAA